MQQLTEQGQRKVNDLAQHYGVSKDAVMGLLQALVNGNGSMAQFYHNDLGGGGQWMRGGMTMVGDMFNHSLKAKVDGLCNELSNLLGQNPFASQPATTQSQYQSGPQHGGSVNSAGGAGLFEPMPSGTSGSWWPRDLGSPNASGGQNNIRYAYFSNACRLAVEINGKVTVYDTLKHQISGVSQQQGGNTSLAFTSQIGTVPVAELPIVSTNGVMQK